MNAASKFAAMHFGGRVRRFHTHDMNTEVRNSEHGWGVALLLMTCYPECTRKDLFYAMTHDCSEILTGDIPSPAKHSQPALKKVFKRSEQEFNNACGIDTPDQYMLHCIKICDYIDMIVHCYREAGLGNTNVDKIVKVCIELISRYGSDYDCVSVAAWDIIKLLSDRFPILLDYIPSTGRFVSSENSLDNLSPLEYGLGGSKNG